MEMTEEQKKSKIDELQGQIDKLQAEINKLKGSSSMFNGLFGIFKSKPKNSTVNSSQSTALKMGGYKKHKKKYLTRKHK